jgi:retron-type reverse transcriptase
MKRHGQLFEQFCSFENLLAASQTTQRAKRYAASTVRFNFQLEQNLLQLRQGLLSGSYRCGAYTHFYIYEPKKRFISAAPYGDRVVHHALCNVIGPIFERTFVYDLYSNRVDKGTHRAVDRYQQFCRLHKYALKCDIRNYFASVDQSILFGLIERKIKDQRLLVVIKQIIESFEKDPAAAGKGMPLGNLTSQLFANLYLNPLDHFITETLGCHHYIRYTDDFVVFGDSKKDLNDKKSRIEAFLSDYQLTLNPNKSRVHRVEDGVVFLGYRIFSNRRLLCQANVRRTKYRLKKLQALYRKGSITLNRLMASLHSWNAHASHADSYRLRTAIYDRYTFAKD